MAYEPLSYDQFTTGYTNLANLTEQNSLNRKLADNTSVLNKTVSGLNQSRQTINNQYQSGLNKLSQTRDAQLPTYTDTANAADARTRIAAKRLSEIMAQRGLSRSGTGLMQQSDIYAQGNADVANVWRDRANFLGGLSNQANELTAQQASGLSDIDRQIALAQIQASDAERAARTEYANNMAAAPLQAALNYPELYTAQTEQAANLLATLLNYNLETGKQAGAISIPTGFKYGDSMINLLKQLGLMTST